MENISQHQTAKAILLKGNKTQLPDATMSGAYVISWYMHDERISVEHRRI